MSAFTAKSYIKIKPIGHNYRQTSSNIECILQANQLGHIHTNTKALHLLTIQNCQITVNVGFVFLRKLIMMNKLVFIFYLVANDVYSTQIS